MLNSKGKSEGMYSEYSCRRLWSLGHCIILKCRFVQNQTKYLDFGAEHTFCVDFLTTLISICVPGQEAKV